MVSEKAPRYKPGRKMTREGTRVIWQQGFREKLGISDPTFWRYKKDGKIPAPDVVIGTRRGWKVETVEAFLNAGAA